jgi:O-antigen/teichoic acid export membrane protein
MSLPPSQPDSPAAPGGGHAHRIVRNSTFSLLSLAISAALSVAVVIVLARGLGTYALGQYYTLFALMMIVQLLTEGGIATVLTARIVQARAAWKEAVAEAMGLLVLVAVVSAAALLGFGAVLAGWRGDASPLPQLAAIAVACVAIQVQQYAAGIFRAFERFEFESLARVFQGAVFVTLAVSLVHRGSHALEVALWAQAASQVLAALFMIGSLQWGWRCLGLRVHLGAYRGWLAEAVPVALGDLFRRLTGQADTLLLSLLQPSAAVVGIYSLACRPLGGLNLIPRAVLLVTFPSFVRLAEGRREVMAHAFARSTRLLWVISLPIAVAVSVCAGPLVLLLGGPEYEDAATPMRILVWISILTFLSAQFRYLFTALGRQRLYVILVGLVFVVESALMAAAIPLGGSIGLSIGFLLGELFFVVLGLAICHSLGLRGIEWGRLARALPGAAVLGGILWLVVDWSLPALAGVGVVAAAGYFVYCYLVGVLLREEVERFATGILALFRWGRRRVSPPLKTAQASNDEDQAAAPGAEATAAWQARDPVC